MARFSRLHVYQTMMKTAIVPIFYNSDIDVVKNVVKAAYFGGIEVFEFTNRGDFAHEVFSELVKWIHTECPNLILGIGSVVDAPTAALYIQLGANFVVSPLLNPEIIKICNRRQIAHLPGCATVSEINVAQELGVEIVKIFPAENIGGASFVKNIKAPMPWTKIMVTGGVEPTRENIIKWLKSGASCLGMGSKLFSAEDISNKRWNNISSVCKKCRDIVDESNNV